MQHSRAILGVTLVGATLLTVYAFFAQESLPDRPRGYPPIVVPADNPLTRDKVELGRFLFYDRRLSVNSTISCADCHQQRYAFADPRPKSVGALGEPTRRNAMSLTNVAYNGRYTWADDRVTTLEAQARIPLTLEHPVEMGFQRDANGILQRFRQNARIVDLFRNAFPDDADPISLANVISAISSFERILISGDSPYDRHWGGDETALSDAAKRGMALFNSPRLKCSNCHGGFNFRYTLGHRKGDDESVAYHNTGLYNLTVNGDYPQSDPGLFDVTKQPVDMGRFKAPTLRNIEVTGPYMHDGSIATLDEVLDHYMGGGRSIQDGPNAGDGSKNPLKSPLLTGFTLTSSERRDVIEFLKSLTDANFLKDPHFGPPGAVAHQ